MGFDSTSNDTERCIMAAWSGDLPEEWKPMLRRDPEFPDRFVPEPCGLAESRVKHPASGRPRGAPLQPDSDQNVLHGGGFCLTDVG